MKKRFHFDFKSLRLEDQKFLLQHFEAISKCPQLIESAKSPLQLKMCYFNEEYMKVVHLSYLAALLAHKIMVTISIPIIHMRKEKIFIETSYDMDYDFEFDLEWYNGLNHEHKGMISLASTIETYELLEIRNLFKKYEFVEDLTVKS